MQRFIPELNQVYAFAPYRNTALLIKELAEFEYLSDGNLKAGDVIRYGIYTEKACFTFITDKRNDKKADKFLKDVYKKFSTEQELSGKREFKTTFIYGA